MYDAVHDLTRLSWKLILEILNKTGITFDSINFKNDTYLCQFSKNSSVVTEQD